MYMYNSSFGTGGLAYSSFGSGYGGYNSFGMYGGYGNVGNVEGVKDNIKNNYSIYATQQSYGNMQNVEGMSQAQRSNVIAELLREGRSNDASKQFSVLCNELKASGLYSEYSNSQIRAIAAEVYQRSTGENLVGAINDTTEGSFYKGLINGIPIVGTFFTDSTSREDLLAKTTDRPKRATDQVAQSIGAGLSGAAISAGAVAGTIGACALFGAKIGTVFGLPGAAFGAIVGGIIGATVGVFKSLNKGS